MVAGVLLYIAWINRRKAGCAEEAGTALMTEASFGITPPQPSKRHAAAVDCEAPE